MTNDDADDFATLDGIQEYISENILPLLKEQVASTGHVLPMGIVFATRANDKDLAEASPIGVLAREEADMEKGVRSRTRKRFVSTHAEGAILVRQENRKVVLQLEHPELGDHVWDITVHDVRDTPVLAAPRSPDQAGVERTAFAPRRYMN